MILNRIKSMQAQLFKDMKTADYVMLNREHLTFLKEELDRDYYGPEDDWTKAIGATLFGMLVVYNHQVTEITMGVFDSYKIGEYK